MALQGIWTGTISFSLVAIPVQLVRAVEPGRVSFRLLHGEDYSPLARRMFCSAEGEIVPPEEIVRGYEIGPDSYIPLTDEELESVSPERSRTIEVVEFVQLDEVDPVYFDHPYYLVPLKGGEKAYQLLAAAMERANVAGIAKFVLAEREHLVAVKGAEGALTLITLHYGEEVLPVDARGEEKVAAGEKGRIKEEIREMMADFDPGKYADERRERVMALLSRKKEEAPPVSAPLAEEGEGDLPADLMAVLTEAMDQVRGNR